MKAIYVSLVLATANAICLGQSGTPSPTGQTITPKGEAAASAAVEARHDRLVARRAAKAAKKAAPASS